jgi:hypothetical protein
MKTASDKFGRFVNTRPIHCEWQGQESWGWLWKVDSWIYYSDPIRPLTYLAPDGRQMQPNRKFHTDFGSIPPPLMALPTLSRTRFLHAYLFHDSGCRQGGLYVRQGAVGAFGFEQMTRAQMDHWLWIWVGAQGGNAYQRNVIYAGVRVGARWDGKAR